MNEKVLLVLSKIANSRKLSGCLICGGILLTCLGNIAVMYGSYYRGVNAGVEARDEYYYQKEIKEYENRKK